MLGFTQQEIAKSLGISAANAGEYLGSAPVREEMQRLLDLADAQFVEEGLLVAEQRAVSTLNKLLDDDDSEVRLKAAVTLLDRAGKRGPVAQRVESTQLALTGDAAQTALANALRDPGVRAFLASQPELRQQVAAQVQEIALLPPPPEPPPSAEAQPVPAPQSDAPPSPPQ